MDRSLKMFVLTTMILCSCNSDLRKANSFLQAGMYDQAVEFTQKVVNENPENLKMHLMQGQAYLLLENHEQAKESFSRALKLDDDYNDEIVDQYFAAIEKLVASDKKELASSYLEYLWVAFTKDNEGLKDKIHKLRLKHKLTLARQLTSGDWDMNPEWHPSGEFLIFNRDQRTTLKVDPFTGDVSPFDYPKKVDALAEMDWSTDGKSIVFWENGTGRDRSSTPNVWRFDIDAQNVYPLTFSRDLWNSNPCWIDNNQKIVFERCDNNSNYEIWVMDKDGNNERRLISGAEVSCSLTDNWILYVRTRNLYAFNVDENHEIQLTHDDKIFSASFSPDRRRIVFVRMDEPAIFNENTKKFTAQGKISIIIADFPRMQNQKIVFQSPRSFDCTPKFSPDQQHIALRGDEDNIWIIDL